jgi:hypothetical protein
VLKSISAKYLTNCCISVRLFILACILIAMIPASSRAQVVASTPYSVSIFATAPNGLSAPDSVTFSSTNVFIGYGNGGAPDGSGGASSNVVEYDFKGNLIKNFTIVGHNDGLRFNPQTKQLWALQNEDGNANLSIINLLTGKQTIYQLGTGPHGGGYDDIDFNNNSIFVSASAPTINPNTAPAIVTLRLSPFSQKAILTGVLNGNASAINVTTGKPQTLNLQDPDSMIVDPLGELVMTSQGDGELIIVQYPGLRCQNALVVPLTSDAGGSTIGNTQLDDTVFATQSAGELLVADKGLNTVYAITAPYFAASAYSAVSVFMTPSSPNPTESFVGQTNLTTGFVTPIVTGMSNPGGMAFIPSGVNLTKFIYNSTQVPEVCPGSFAFPPVFPFAAAPRD